MEAVQQIKNCHSLFARRSYTGSSSSTPWNVSATSTAAYPFRGAYTAPSTSCRRPRAASTLTHSVHGPDHGWASDQSQQAQLQSQSLENMTCYKRSLSCESAFVPTATVEANTSLKTYDIILKKKRNLKPTNTDNRQYPRCCRHHRCLCLRMGDHVEKAKEMEVGRRWWRLCNG